MPTSRTGKILIVDDNDQMSSLLADILELFDYQSQAVTDGEEALRKIQQEKFDMVITDLRMPRMSGTELLKLVKNIDPSLPVVVVSGFTPGNTQGIVISQQADGFLNKPFTVQQIEKLLKDLLHYNPR
ncbi:MAG: response regulator [candidate division Zixibacteria bacterium]|nr:response regulator [candidate division Zixibacteria bacterium]